MSKKLTSKTSNDTIITGIEIYKFHVKNSRVYHRVFV